MSELARLAGNNEYRCIARDSLGLYGSIVVAGKYVNQKSSLTKDQLYKALKQCIDRNAVLSTIIEFDPKGSRPRLRQASAIQLDRHVNWVDNQSHGRDDNPSVRQILSLAHSKRHSNPETTPQWQVYITSPSSTPQSSILIAFACSHALTDGRSCLIFHRSLLDALNTLEVSSHGTDAEYLVPESRQIGPALEDAARLTITWHYFLSVVLGDVLPLVLSRWLGFKTMDSDGFWRGASTPPQAHDPAKLVTTSLHHFSIPDQLLVQILAKCKREKVKLTALINFLVAQSLRYSLAKHFSPASAPSSSPSPASSSHNIFRIATPIDLRALVQISSEEMGCYPSVIEDVLHFDPDDHQDSIDWSAVKTMTDTISRRASTLVDQPVAMLRYLSDHHQWMREKATKVCSESFETSNLGTFLPPFPVTEDDSQCGKGKGWKIEDVVFSQSANGVGPPFNVNVVSSKGGPLNFVVTWMPGRLGIDDEQRFIEDLSETLALKLKAVAETMD